MSEDTCEVAIKSFLQIILAHNLPEARLIKPLDRRGTTLSAMGKNKVLMSSSPPASLIN
jgi:hypothetical protein